MCQGVMRAQKNFLRTLEGFEISEISENTEFSGLSENREFVELEEPK